MVDAPKIMSVRPESTLRPKILYIYGLLQSHSNMRVFLPIWAKEMAKLATIDD